MHLGMNKMKHRFSRTGVHFGKNEGIVRSGTIICMEDGAVLGGGVDTTVYTAAQNGPIGRLSSSFSFFSFSLKT